MKLQLLAIPLLVALMASPMLASAATGTITFSSPASGASYAGTQTYTITGTISPAPTLPDNVVITVTLQGGSPSPLDEATVAVGAGGTFNVKGAPSPYRIGNIPDGTSNTIGLVETSGCFPAFPTINPQSGTAENYMTWDYPAYPNTLGPYWPNPDELPGQPHFTGLFALPQIGVRPTQADPNLCQSYHTGVMNLGLMDGSVRNISAAVSATTWTNALNPADGQALGPDW